MKKTQTIRTHSPAGTKRAARSLAKDLKRGDVLALYGDLGAGKTTFVKGLAKGLGVRSEKDVSSPTFVLIHEYAGKERIFHLDWYRLTAVGGADAEFAQECFPAGITLIEWPERGRDLLPRKRIEVRIRRLGPTERRIVIRKVGAR